MKRKLNIDFVGFGTACPLAERLVNRLVDRNYEICCEGKPDYVVVQPLPWREGDWMRLTQAGLCGGSCEAGVRML